MTAAELRLSIEQHILSDDFLIMQYPDTPWLADTYVRAIAFDADLEINYVDSLDEVDNSRGLLDVFDQTLYVIHTDSFADLRSDYSTYSNVIVITKSVDKKVVKYADSYIVKLIALDAWMLSDYIEVQLPALSDDARKFICNVTQKDPFKIDNIINQLSVFEPDEQMGVLRELALVEGTDLYYNDVFTLVDAIVNVILNQEISTNMHTIKDILRHRNCCDITALYVLTILLAKLRNIAIICYGGKVKASAFLDKNGKSMSDKQYNYFHKTFYPAPMIKNRNEAAISKAISFLSKIDSELKLGKIELSDEYFLDYIITSLFAQI